jgi:ATP-dependent Clp protease ATP-binding subunit ClpC
LSTDDRANGEPVEAVVRRVGRALDRLDDLTVDDYLEDEDFEVAVSLLTGADVEHAVVARLAKDPSLAVTCIAIEAIRRRGAPPPEWIRWALRRTRQGGYVETCFALRALAVADEPVIARVIKQSSDGWEDEELLQAVAEFVRQRLDAGEEFEPAALADLGSEQESFLRSLGDEFDDGLPPPLERALTHVRRSNVDLEFFQPFSTLVELGDDPPLVLSEPRERVVRAIVDAVTTRRSVLLVGEHGVGKTMLVHEALRRLADDGWVAFRSAPEEVHGGTPYSGELETRVQGIAARADGRTLAWHLPSFEGSIWAGQWSGQPRGLLDALLPAVESKRIVIVGELEPSALTVVLRQRPRADGLFDVVHVAPLDEAEATSVVRAELAEGDGPAATEETLLEANDLARHYFPGSASPGNVVRLARAARSRAEERGAAEVETEDVIGGLAAATGLPLDILDHRTPLDLDAVKEFFLRRVLGQPEAVDCLVERIAMIKAGLTDPTRPLGVFLLVGPTGTGKTELAKALAEYLFGSAERLVRLDMTEFQTWDSVDRLLGDNATQPRAAALVSSVRERPFSVVLLDEFEKAEWFIWDLFLQVFDDGRLTDQSGRTVDFRHCVILLTSNVGSAIHDRPSLGFMHQTRQVAPAHVERAVQRQFRPELLNRLDRVVVFQPLERGVMRRLLEHELRSVLARRGFRVHPWAVEWDDGAVDFLLEKGFTADLGARPLKRAVERYLLAPLATAIVGREVPEGDQFLFITAAGDRLGVSFLDPDAGETAPSAGASVASIASLVVDPRGGDAELAALTAERERLLPQVESWVARKADALDATREPGFWERGDRAETLAFVEYVDRLEAAWRTGERLAERLGRGHGRPTLDGVRLLAQRLYLIERALAGMEQRRAADAFLRVAPAGRTRDVDAASAFAVEIGLMYERWASARGMRFESVDGGDGSVTAGVVGLAAFTILAGEAGLHVLEMPVEDRPSRRVSVRVTVAPWSFGHPAGGDIRDAAERSLAAVPAERTVVRRYRREPSPLVRDTARGWRTGRIDRVLAGDFDVIA